MKKFSSFLTGVVVGGLIFGTFSIATAAPKTIEAIFDNIKIKINGKIINTGDDQPFLYNGRTYVPARYVAQELGASVKYNEIDNTVEIDSDSPQTPTPTNAPTATAAPAAESTGTYQKNGLTVYSIDGVEYVSLFEIGDKSDPKIRFIDDPKNNLVDVYLDGEHKGRVTIELFTTSKLPAKTAIGTAVRYDDYINIIEPILK